MDESIIYFFFYIHENFLKYAFDRRETNGEVVTTMITMQ